MNWSTKRWTRHWLKSTPLVCLLLAAPANAAILPGVAVDGPSNLIQATGPAIDVAPDRHERLGQVRPERHATHRARMLDRAVAKGAVGESLSDQQLGWLANPVLPPAP